MSSNSSAPDRPAEGLLRGALATLAREAPWHARALGEALDGRSCALRVGDERLWLSATGLVAAVSDAPVVAPRGAIEVTLALSTALRLLDGNAEVTACLLDRSLCVRGEVSQVVAFTRVADVMLHGLVRSPSSRALLDSLRRAVERSAPSSPFPENLDD